MYWARPSIKILLSLTSGVIILSTRMAVPALILCERPMGIPSFQKELPFQYSIPLAKLWIPSFPRWCSYMRRIYGGAKSEVSQALISFSLGELSLRLRTLREAIVRGFSIIGESASGGW